MTEDIQEKEPSLWQRWRRRAQRHKRRLRIIETLPLGERRFVAIVAVDGCELLVGGTPHALGLLGELSAAHTQDAAGGVFALADRGGVQ